MDALDILSSAAAVIAEGEVMQLARRQESRHHRERLSAVIRSQDRGALRRRLRGRAAPSRAARRPRSARLRAYGMTSAIAFQLIDDALDYGGHPRRSARTSATISARARSRCRWSSPFASGTAEERAFWRRVMEEGDIRDGDLERAIALLHRHEAIEATTTRAIAFGEEAHRALSIFPDGDMHRALAQTVDFAIARDR